MKSKNIETIDLKNQLKKTLLKSQSYLKRNFSLYVSCIVFILSSADAMASLLSARDSQSSQASLQKEIYDRKSQLYDKDFQSKIGIPSFLVIHFLEYVQALNNNIPDPKMQYKSEELRQRSDIFKRPDKINSLMQMILDPQTQHFSLAYAKEKNIYYEKDSEQFLVLATMYHSSNEAQIEALAQNIAAYKIASQKLEIFQTELNKASQWQQSKRLLRNLFLASYLQRLSQDKQISKNKRKIFEAAKTYFLVMTYAQVLQETHYTQVLFENTIAMLNSNNSFAKEMALDILINGQTKRMKKYESVFSSLAQIKGSVSSELQADLQNQSKNIAKILEQNNFQKLFELRNQSINSIQTALQNFISANRLNFYTYSFAVHEQYAQKTMEKTGATNKTLSSKPSTDLIEIFHQLNLAEKAMQLGLNQDTYNHLLDSIGVKEPSEILSLQAAEIAEHNPQILASKAFSKKAIEDFYQAQNRIYKSCAREFSKNE